MALPTRIGRLRLPVLCFVVSTSDARDGEVERVVGEAITGGATMVLLREETMPAGDLLALARRVKSVTRGKALLVVYDRVDTASRRRGAGDATQGTLAAHFQGLDAAAAQSQLFAAEPRVIEVLAEHNEVVSPSHRPAFGRQTADLWCPWADLNLALVSAAVAVGRCHS